MESTYILAGNFIHGAYYIAHGTKDDMERACESLKHLVVDELKVVEFNDDTLDELIDNSTEFTKVFNTFLTEDNSDKIENEFEAEWGNNFVGEYNEEDDPFANIENNSAKSVSGHEDFSFDDDEDDLLG